MKIVTCREDRNKAYCSVQPKEVDYRKGEITQIVAKLKTQKISVKQYHSDPPVAESKKGEFQVLALFFSFVIFDMLIFILGRY